MNEENRNTLRRVLATLNGISVSGKENMDYMLGAMITLEQLINAPEEAKTDE